MKETGEKTIASWSGMLDVPIELVVELGRTHLKVRDILNLNKDSIVTLSRSTGEGVDVRADDLPLVRGEIVVIEDRAGIRVSEIFTEEN